MKVILTKDMKKLGKNGQTVEVKNGYARNYLLPMGFALPATTNNVSKLERITQARTKAEQKIIDKALKLKADLEQISLTLTATVKDDEEIYGSIGEAQIVKSLKAEGIDTEGIELTLNDPIRKLGAYTVKIRLSSRVEADLRIWVVKK